MRKIDWDENGPLENWQRAVLAFARRARRELGDRIVHIILYGSRARGDYTEDSDIDVLVVVRDVDAKEADERAETARLLGGVTQAAKWLAEAQARIAELEKQLAADG